VAQAKEEELWLVTHRALRKIPRIDAVWRWAVEEAAAARPSSRARRSAP